MAATFTVMNDQSGDEKEVSLKEWEKLQLQGYRIADVAAYNACLNDGADPASEPTAAPAEAKMAAQTASDASKLAAEQYPDAKPAAVDKPKESKRS